MKKTAYIRVGTDKAGTVSIANFVSDNRTTLAKLNVIAPGRNCIGFLDYVVKHNALADIDCFCPEKFFENYPRERQYLDEFIKDMHSARYKDKTLLLTTETLWGRLSRQNLNQPNTEQQALALLQAIKAFFPDHQIKILLHLRRADTYIESLFGQHIKAGGTVPRADFIRRKVFREFPTTSLKLLQMFSAVFGPDNMLIKPFERQQFKDNDLLADLMETVGIYRYKNRFALTVGNESLHSGIIAVLSETNKAQGKILSNKDLLLISGYLKNPLKIPSSSYFLSRQERLNLLQKFNPLYEHISDTFLAGKSLFNDPLPPDTAISQPLPTETLGIIKKILFECHGQTVNPEFLSRFSAYF